jgi:GNAT superfamily N-acetyltransferase
MNEQLVLDLECMLPERPTGPTLIRDLEPTETDRRLVLRFGKLIFEESKKLRVSFKERVYNENKSAEFFECWKQGADIFCAVAEKRGIPIGIMSGCIYPSHIFDGNVAYDLFLYVLPEHRGSTIAKRLIAKYEQWAMQQDVLEIGIGVSSGINPERTGALYEKLGYQNVGSNYVKAGNV